MDENKELNIAETEAENNMNVENNDMNSDVSACQKVNENEDFPVSAQPNFAENQPNFAENQPNLAPDMFGAYQVERVDPPIQAEGCPFPPEYQQPAQPIPQPMPMYQPMNQPYGQPPIQPVAPQSMQPMNQSAQPAVQQPMGQPSMPCGYPPAQPIQQPVASQPAQPIQQQPVAPQFAQPQYNRPVPPYAPQPQGQYQPYPNQPQPIYYPNQANNQNYQPYGNYPYGYRNNAGSGLAITAMICGICGLALWWGFVTGIILGTIGVVFGFVARSKGQKNGLSMTGIVTGFIALGLSLLMILVVESESYELYDEYDYDDDYYYEEYDRRGEYDEYDERDFDRYFDEKLEDYRNGNI